MNSVAIDAMWCAFLESRADELPASLSYYEAFQFGGHLPEIADDLAALVLAGEKTATSDLLWSYEADGRRHMQPGDFSVVVNGRGDPVCITETLEVAIRPFEDVDAQFAYDYGEDDRTLAGWRSFAWTYYVDECAAHGWEANPSMPLVCERFHVVYLM